MSVSRSDTGPETQIGRIFGGQSGTAFSFRNHFDVHRIDSVYGVGDNSVGADAGIENEGAPGATNDGFAPNTNGFANGLRLPLVVDEILVVLP